MARPATRRRRRTRTWSRSGGNRSRFSAGSWSEHTHHQENLIKRDRRLAKEYKYVCSLDNTRIRQLSKSLKWTHTTSLWTRDIWRMLLKSKKTKRTILKCLSRVKPVLCYVVPTVVTCVELCGRVELMVWPWGAAKHTIAFSPKPHAQQVNSKI